MRRALTITVAGLLVLAACGGDDGDDGDNAADAASNAAGADAPEVEGLQGVLAQIRDAGIKCNGTPGPYEPGENEMEIGDPPVEEFTCQVNGRLVKATRWESANDRGVAVKMATEMGCGFGMQSIAWIEADDWTVGMDDTTDEDMAVLDRLSDALERDVTTKECDG